MSGQNVAKGTGQKTDTGRIWAGLRLPFLRAGQSSPSFFSAADSNPIIALANAVMNLRVNLLNADGSAAANPARVSIAEDSIAIDIPIGSSGGSGGSLILCGVTAESAEYVTVQPLQATADATYVPTGGPNFKVAKPFALRALTGAAISPAYASAVIFAAQSPTGGTGVVVGGVDVGYEDVNVDARIPTPAAASSVVKVVWDSDAGDYFVAHDTFSTSYNVAKLYHLRNSTTSETIWGQSFTYVYSGLTGPSGQFRSSTRSSDSFVEYQGVHPQYSASEVILITKITGLTGVGSAPDWIELAPSRDWVAPNDQSYGH